MYVSVNTEARSCNHFTRRKATGIKYSECTEVPSVKRACVILSSVACRTPLCFSTLSYKRSDFRKIIEYEMRVLIFSTSFV